jgi:hypothetical protein
MEKEKEENHVKAMKKRENLNREVMLMFENYVLRHNLRTMLLIEFHNGGNNVIGLPFLKMTATMEYSSINKPEYYITNYIVNQPTSNFQNIYNTLENNEIILYEYGSGDKYLDYLMSIGYQSHMIKLYPIKVDNCLVGVIVVCSQGVLEPGFNTHMLPLIEKIQLYNSQNKR